MKLSTVRTLTYSLWAVMVFLLIVVWYADMFILVYPAIGLAFLSVLMNHLFWKCPHCGAKLGRIEKQNHCHNCGKKLEM